VQHGLDEADRFYENPEKFLDCAGPRGMFSRRSFHGPKMPTLIVAFQGLEPRIKGFCETCHHNLPEPSFPSLANDIFSSPSLLLFSPPLFKACRFAQLDLEPF